MSSGLNFHQLSSTQTFAVPRQPYSVGTYQSNSAKGARLAFLLTRSTPGCRYIQGLQHPHSPTSDLERKVACIKASMDQTSRQSFIPFCLSLQNCWLCPSGLSAPPEEFLLASLVGVKTLSIVISRNFVEYVFTFPFSVVNDICIVFHFGAEKMMFQVNCEGWRSGFGKAFSNELITYFFSNHIIT